MILKWDRFNRLSHFFNEGMNMKTYTVKIKTPGHMIVFNGKRARTPVVYEHILEKDLSVFELQARRSMLEYEITDESTIVKESVIEEIETRGGIPSFW